MSNIRARQVTSLSYEMAEAGMLLREGETGSLPACTKTSTLINRQ